jgi:hypothetical protein
MSSKPRQPDEPDHLELLEAAKDLRIDPHKMLEALRRMSAGQTVGVESELNDGK